MNLRLGLDWVGIANLQVKSNSRNQPVRRSFGNGEFDGQAELRNEPQRKVAARGDATSELFAPSGVSSIRSVKCVEVP